MRTLILAAVAAASLAASVPLVALAQDAMHDHADHMAGEHMDRPMGDWSLDRREEWLQGRILRASEHGHLSGNEEKRGQGELDAIRAEHARLKDRDGGQLTEADHTYLANRINELNRTLRWQGENPPAPWMM